MNVTNIKTSLIIFKAIKDIKKDDEIFHDYGKDWFDKYDNTSLYETMESTITSLEASIFSLKGELEMYKNNTINPKPDKLTILNTRSNNV